MRPSKAQTQSDAQAGSPGEAAEVGLAVGVLRSSDEAPVMGSRAKAGCSSGSQRRLGLMAPAGDRSLGRESSILTIATAVNVVVEPDPESRIREIRSSGLMRGRSVLVIGTAFQPNHSGLLYCWAEEVQFQLLGSWFQVGGRSGVSGQDSRESFPGALVKAAASCRISPRGSRDWLPLLSVSKSWQGGTG